MSTDLLKTTKKNYNISFNEANGQSGSKKIDPNSISIRVPDIISNTDKSGKFPLNDDDQSEDELFSRKEFRPTKNQQANNSNQTQIQQTVRSF